MGFKRRSKRSQNDSEVTLPKRGLPVLNPNQSNTSYALISTTPLLNKEQEKLAFQLHLEDTQNVLNVLGWTPEFYSSLESYVSEKEESKNQRLFYGDEIVPNSTLNLQSTERAQKKLYDLVQTAGFEGTLAQRQQFTQTYLGALTHSSVFPLVEDVLTLYQKNSSLPYAKEITSAATPIIKQYEDRRTLFIEANMRLAQSIAGRFRLGTYTDRVQEAMAGLIKAHERFEYRRGFKFSTYATWWIRHVIGRSCVDNERLVRIPVHIHESLVKIRDLTYKFSKGREETPEDFRNALAELKINPKSNKAKQLSELYHFGANPFSLDQNVKISGADSGPSETYYSLLGTNETAGKNYDLTELSSLLNTELDKLSPMEQDILRSRFAFVDTRDPTQAQDATKQTELMLHELGSKYNLSRERIRQIQEKALGKLQKWLEPKGADDFLSDDVVRGQAHFTTK